MVAEWPEPTSVKDVRAWLGLTGYYRRYVKDYARVAAPLTSVLKHGIKFEWTDEMQRSFDELKTALTTPPILAMPTVGDVFTLDTDASDVAIGGVLSQFQGGSERVIAYGSRKLSRTEKNYSVTRRELLAIIYFLKYFRHYLLNTRFPIRTDHAALLWLRRIPEPVGQQARWLELMEEYTFFVEHRPGKAHSKADALSRIPTRIYREETEHAVRIDETVAEQRSNSLDAMRNEPSDGDSSANDEDVVHQIISADHEVLDNDMNNVGAEELSREPVSRIPQAVEVDIGTFEAARLENSDSLLSRIRAAQEADVDMSVILSYFVAGTPKLSWDDVTAWSAESKAL
jgi:hypothetical protein